MEDFYDQIDIYLNDGLDASQKAAFEAALANDAALQLAVKRHQGLIEELHGLRLRESIRKHMVRPAPAARPHGLPLWRPAGKPGLPPACVHRRAPVPGRQRAAWRLALAP